MEGRARRAARQIDRLAPGGALIDVDEALADYEDVMETDEEVEVEEQQQQQPEGSGRPAKAARRGARAAAAAAAAAAAPATLNPAAFSTLLAGAPRLVDLLLEEDSVRCITLCARDACNLAIAGGGKVDLAPLWNALATRIRNKTAAEQAAAAAAAAEQAEAEAFRHAEVVGALAAVAPAALEAGGGAGQPQAQQQAQQPAAAAAADAPSGSRPAGKAEAEPAGLQRRRGRGKARAPAPPSDLEVVKAAVAADPARTTDVRKTEKMWEYRLTAKHLQGAQTHRSRCIMISELDVLAAAHKKHGDWQQLQAAKRAATERSEQRREAWEKRQAEDKVARQEELAMRVAEAGLPDILATSPRRHGTTVQHYDLDYWLLYGPRWGGVDLGETLAPIVTAHNAKVAREERERLLNEGLEAEGLQFFKADFRYRAFVANGIAESLQEVLDVARQQAQARQEAFERANELEERLEAVGLPPKTRHVEMLHWLDTGEGNIERAVAQARAKQDRELDLSEALSVNGLLYRLNDPLCIQFVRGDLKGNTAADVAQMLLDDLTAEHDRSMELQSRLMKERLPPSSLDYWCCKRYIREGVVSLDTVIKELRSNLYRRECLPVPPPGRAWLRQSEQAELEIAEGGGDSVEAAAADPGAALGAS